MDLNDSESEDLAPSRAPEMPPWELEQSSRLSPRLKITDLVKDKAGVDTTMRQFSPDWDIDIDEILNAGGKLPSPPSGGSASSPEPVPVKKKRRTDVSES